MSDRDVGWGILSTANITSKVHRAMDLAAGATPLAVASRSEDKAKAWAKEHNVPKAYGSYEALLQDPDIEAVYIALPPSLHAEWTIRAAEHGKNVLCEKPLAGSTSDAIAMWDACKTYNVQLMDGVMWVHHQRAEQMKEHLEELGRIRRVTSAFCFQWDTVPEDNIRLKPELAGGCLGDLGYYCVRAIWWALEDVPTEVFATARYYNDVEMSLSAMLWYDGERMASFDCSFDTQMRQWLEVAGTEGSLVCDDFALPWSEQKARWWLHDGKGNSKEFSVADCIQEVRMIEEFSRLVDTGELESSWPNDSISTMRVCDALATSARRNQRIEVAG